MKIPIRILHPDRTHGERCDTCGHRAYILMVHRENLALHLGFCAHHYGVLRSRLAHDGWVVEVDDRPLLEVMV